MVTTFDLLTDWSLRLMVHLSLIICYYFGYEYTHIRTRARTRLLARSLTNCAIKWLEGARHTSKQEIRRRRKKKKKNHPINLYVHTHKRANEHRVRTASNLLKLSLRRDTHEEISNNLSQPSQINGLSEHCQLQGLVPKGQRTTCSGKALANWSEINRRWGV